MKEGKGTLHYYKLTAGLQLPTSHFYINYQEEHAKLETSEAR